MNREDLVRIVGESCVWQQEPLGNHTTFRIGGPAAYFVAPDTVEDLVSLAAYLREQGEPWFLMGNGSNLLVSDQGYAGVAVATHMTGKEYTSSPGKMALDEISFFFSEEEKKQALEKCLGDVSALMQGLEDQALVRAGAGAMLSSLASQAARNGLEGLAFAGGIPGTLGGAVAMNAGAYGGEIRDCILGAMLLLPDGTQRFYSREELQLGYRTSIIQSGEYLVLWGLFALRPGDAQSIEAQMREFNNRRKEKQPLEYASAGSTFKRPEGYFAGKLIEDAGLRGYRTGDVMVSEKHCGFVVNVGKGTCGDAMDVISHVQQTVEEKFGVKLELEVRIIGGG